jgi:hypothetical protein
MYKIFDKTSNSYIIFDTYIEACNFKGIDPKKAYKYKHNTKDRPKVFPPILSTRDYITAWISANNLKC